MDSAVRKLVGWDEIPEIEIMPVVGGCLLHKHLTIVIVSPARIKEIIADVAVAPIADEHRLVD